MNYGISFLAFIYALLHCISLSGQSKSVTPLRDVIVMSGDTVIKVTVLSTSLNVRYNSGKRYYWYGQGQVSGNMGGSGGKLLHGSYRSFIDGRLVVSGSFNSGLKNGIWSTWDKEGVLVSQVTWRNGEKVVAKNRSRKKNSTDEEKGPESNSSNGRDRRKGKTMIDV